MGAEAIRLQHGRSARRTRRTQAPMKRVATPTSDRPPARERTHHARKAGARVTRGGRASPPPPQQPPEQPASAAEHQSLSKYIRARFDECSRSQKDVAQYIVDHLDEAAFQTAEELARRANTSSSTVVRFSQALGFEGFPELQSAAREEYRRRRVEDTTAVSLSGPLFALDQTEFETA